MENTSNINSSRIFGLDLLRTMAIIFVVISHAKPFIDPIIPDWHLIRFLGFWGVELFFVLSGFLIGDILINLFISDNKISFKEILNFWKRRWFRTLPNYYLILIVNIILFFFFIEKEIKLHEIFPYFVFLQNLISLPGEFYPESWSLAVEEWFYLIFPLVLVFSFRFFSKVFGKEKAFLIAIIMLLLFSVFLKVCLTYIGDYHWSTIKKIVVLRFDSILTGVFLKWCFSKFRFFSKKANLLLILGLLLLTISFQNYMNDLLYVYGAESSFFSKTLYFNVTSVGFALIIPFAIKIQVKENVINKFIVTISKISYSMYLVHFSIAFPIASFSFQCFSFIGLFGEIFIYLILSYLFSKFLYKYFEQPILLMRDK